MSFLLDTNVVSEWIKPEPHPGVIGWLTSVDEEQVFLSVLTLAEVRHGLERIAPGSRRDRLDRWLREDLPLRFTGRVLAIDAAVADAWGKPVALSLSRGRPFRAMDAFLAAIARVHSLILVTRDVSDFAVPVFNPWA